MFSFEFFRLEKDYSAVKKDEQEEQIELRVRFIV
jgi:hypothetical protein